MPVIRIASRPIPTEVAPSGGAFVRDIPVRVIYEVDIAALEFSLYVYARKQQRAPLSRRLLFNGRRYHSVNGRNTPLTR